MWPFKQIISGFGMGGEEGKDSTFVLIQFWCIVKCRRSPEQQSPGEGG